MKQDLWYRCVCIIYINPKIYGSWNNGQRCIFHYCSYARGLAYCFALPMLSVLTGWFDYRNNGIASLALETWYESFQQCWDHFYGQPGTSVIIQVKTHRQLEWLSLIIIIFRMVSWHSRICRKTERTYCTSYRKISRSPKLRYSGLKFPNRYRDACQISKRCDHYNIQSHGFETSWDLPIRRLTA